MLYPHSFDDGNGAEMKKVKYKTKSHMNVVNVVLSFITRPNVFHVHCVALVLRKKNNIKQEQRFSILVGNWRCELHNVNSKWKL